MWLQWCRNIFIPKGSAYCNLKVAIEMAEHWRSSCLYRGSLVYRGGIGILLIVGASLVEKLW